MVLWFKRNVGNAGDPLAWDMPVIFGIIFVLSVLELGFTIDTFQYLQRTNSWTSTTERQRIGFLMFSSIRTVLLSAVYIGFHFARKFFGSMHHTIFLVLSAVFWIISGALIHDLLGYLECGGVGSPKGGLSECHELKIIEILSWIIGFFSLLSTIPFVMRSMKHRKNQVKRKVNEKSGNEKTAMSA